MSIFVPLLHLKYLTEIMMTETELTAYRLQLNYKFEIEEQLPHYFINKFYLSQIIKNTTTFTFFPCYPNPTSLRASPHWPPAPQTDQEEPSCHPGWETRDAHGQGQRRAACTGLGWRVEERWRGLLCPLTIPDLRSKRRDDQSGEPSFHRKRRNPKR